MPAKKPPVDQAPSTDPPTTPDVNPDPAPVDVDPAPVAPAAVTAADTAALTGHTSAAAGTPAPRRRIVVSEGVWHDLIRLGEVTEPGSGYLLRLNPDSRAVTAHHRGTGAPVDIPIQAPTIR